MSRLAAVAVLGAGLLLQGCGAAQHVPPAAGAPYALAKVRVVHHAGASADLKDRVWLNGDEIPLAEHTANGATTTARRIAPGGSRWRVHAVFSHFDPMQHRTFNSAPNTRCGTDPNGRPLLCPSFGPAAVNSYDDPEVIDAICNAELEHVAEANQIYLVRFDFYANDYCTARCMVQTFDASGQFQLQPCTR